MKNCVLIFSISLLLFSCKKEVLIHKTPIQDFVFKQYPYYEKYRTDSIIIYQSLQDTAHKIYFSIKNNPGRYYETCYGELPKNGCPYAIYDDITIDGYCNWDWSYKVPYHSIYFDQRNEHPNGRIQFYNFSGSFRVDNYLDFEQISTKSDVQFRNTYYPDFDDDLKEIIITSTLPDRYYEITFNEYYGVSKIVLDVEVFDDWTRSESTITRETFKPVF